MILLLKLVLLSVASLLLSISLLILAELAVKLWKGNIKFLPTRSFWVLVGLLIVLLLLSAFLIGCAGQIDFDGNVKGHGNTSSHRNERTVGVLATPNGISTILASPNKRMLIQA